MHVKRRSESAQTAGGTYVGHCRVNAEPAHEPFRAAGIPETSDLNVMPAHRRQGAASRILDLAESLIGETSSRAGIGVGLYRDYGAAQRLYASRGYVLDGTGAWWNHMSVGGGDTVVADDDLVLYLIKNLDPRRRSPRQ